MNGESIDTAIEMFIEHHRGERSPATLQAYRYRLSHLKRWADEQGIDSTAELTGKKLHQYRVWRREDGGLNNVTMQTQLSTLRVFIRWLEQIDAVESGLHERILLPKVGRREDERDVMLEAEEARKLIEYLRKLEFATRVHAVVEVLWHTGMRIGALHGLDLNDYHSEEELLELRHRPDQGTRLKNGLEGERYVAIKPDVCDALDAYIKYHRHDVTDDYGRQPLFTSKYGRPSKSSIRDSIYRITRPCIYTQRCPHGREQDDCEAMERNKASRCPSSVSPHAIRRGSITHHLSKDMPENVVGDRMNVSMDILEKHYDRRSERGKAEQRRDYLDDI